MLNGISDARQKKKDKKKSIQERKQKKAYVSFSCGGISEHVDKSLIYDF